MEAMPPLNASKVLGKERSSRGNKCAYCGEPMASARQALRFGLAGAVLVLPLAVVLAIALAAFIQLL
jgi:hypothetical protein